MKTCEFGGFLLMVMKTYEFWGFLFAIYTLPFDRDRMVVGFPTAYAMSDYHH